MLQSGTEFGKIKRTESGSWVPSSGGRITLHSTSGVITLCDITKPSLTLVRVEKRVDETKVGFALGLAVVVQDRDQSGPRRRRSGCAENAESLTVDDNLEIL